MSNSGLARQQKRLPPLSIRLNASERDVLVGRAGGLPLSTYIKAVLLGDDTPSVRHPPRPAPIDRELAARILAALGATRIASNLAQLARQANLGSFYFDEDTKTDLQEACRHVRDIRALLMQALGKDTGGSADAFNRASQPGGRP